jgi:hypothetical protein
MDMELMMAKPFSDYIKYIILVVKKGEVERYIDLKPLQMHTKVITKSRVSSH